MNLSLKHRQPPSAVPATPGEADAIFAQARALLASRQSLPPRPLLRGKKLVLFCDDDSLEPARRFREAAAELGAHVSHVRPSLTVSSTRRDIEYTARMLGRLYDAIECIEVAPPLVDALRDAAGVPVYQGLATDAHPSATLAERLDPAAAPAERRRALVQALLMATIG